MDDDEEEEEEMMMMGMMMPKEEKPLSFEPPPLQGNPNCRGLGPPSLGFRNRLAYEHMRGKPENLDSRRHTAAYKDATLFQRWKPSFMIPTSLLKEVLYRDHYVPLQARKKDAVMRQGNALALVPFMRDAANKTLIVHAGGHVLDSIYMSILEHPEPLEERVKEEDHMDGDDDHKPPPGGGGASRYDWPCSMSGSRVARLGMSTIQQICRVPTESQDEDDRGGYPLQFMARAGCEAQLFAIDSQKRIGMPDNIRFSVMPKYKLQFPAQLSDIACRSSQRIAFITENSQLYEWSSVQGAIRCGQSFVAPEGEDKVEGASKPRLAWGCHPRTLWVASGGRLHLVDLRQGQAVKLYCLEHSQVYEGGEPASAQILSMCRHPTNSNLLFVGADNALRLMDVRFTRQPVSSRLESETSSLLSTVSTTFPWANMEGDPDTLVVAAGHNLGRIHLHHWFGGPEARSDLPLKGILRSWCSGVPALETATSLDHTFFNCDAYTNRGHPAHLAGLALVTPPSTSVSYQRVCIPFMNSMGDVYIQQAVALSPGSDMSNYHCHGAELPCGVDAHYIQTEGENKGPRMPSRPSVSIPTQYSPKDLRSHVSMDMGEAPYAPRHQQHPTEAVRELSAILDEFYDDLTSYLTPGGRSLFEVYSYLASLAPELRAFNYADLHEALIQESAIEGFKCNTQRLQANRPQEVLRKPPSARAVPVEGPTVERACQCRIDDPNKPPCTQPDCLAVDWWMYWVIGPGPTTTTTTTSSEAARGHKVRPGITQDTLTFLRGQWHDASVA